MKSHVAFGLVVLVGLAMAAAVPAPEVTEKTSPITSNPSSLSAKKPEVTEKTSPITVNPSSLSATKPEVTEKTSAPTGSRSSRAAKEPEVTEKTSPVTGSPSALPSKKPEVAEKTSPQTGSPSHRASRRPEVTETAAPIEVEGAEEPKQADRTKKSASTTFCVEIRPGPSEAPVKVCENPSPPAHHHETHEQLPPPPPTYLHESEVPVYIVPSCAEPEVLLSNDPCPPQGLSYHQSVPCSPGCCPSTCACANRPHAQISLFRSAMAPNDGAHAQIDGTEMRSNGLETSGLEAEAIDAGITGREAGSENGETPMARTFLRDHYGHPLYHGRLFGQRYPHLFRYHPHLLPVGYGRAVDGTSGLENNEHIMAVNGQPAMETSQQGRYLVHPYTSPVAGYQSHPVYQYHQSPAIPYSAAHHSVYPGYAVRPHQATVVLDRHSMPMYANQAIVGPGSAHRYRSDQQRPLPIKSDQQQQQQKNQEKSWSEDRHATDQKNRSDQSGPTSPSQILNRMRGSGEPTSFDLRPVMQTFPRNNEERIGNENGLSVNMNFPRGGQPFMIPGSRMTDIENKLKSGDCGDGEIGKRDAEKSAGEKDN